ncbi:MAG: hypothetical protein U1A73_04205, partial [Pseudomonas sp.]|nr:hypothetical protein [Pseudomonas sp.]
SFYTHAGKAWKVINELGAITVTNYDAAGRAVQVTAPAVDGVSAVTSVVYDEAGNAIQQQDPLGRIVVTEYDARNRPWRVTAPPVWDAENGGFVHPQTTTEYDALGQVTKVTDPAGHFSSKHYDAAGRVWKVVDALGNATKSSYDPNGNVLTLTDALERTVTNTYDNLNRLTASVDAAGIENEFAYDAAGNRTRVKDGLDHATNFVYDGLNRLISQTFVNGNTTTFAYNAIQKTGQTDAKGVTTSYTYDERDRLLTATATGLARTCVYDDGGRLLSVVEANHPEATVEYTYDILGRVLTESSQGVVHTYGYDIAGNRISAAYGTGRTILTSYDALNRPETIAEGGRLTRYGYDLVGRAMLMISGNGQVTENIYDEAGRLTNRTLFTNLGNRTATGVQAEFAWQHDDVGNVTEQTETWSGAEARTRVTVMEYDGANRLESEEIAETVAAVTTTVTTMYGYDDANNRLTKLVDGGTEPGYWACTYNDANQLTHWEKRTAVNGSVVRKAKLEYDANGNRIAQRMSAVDMGLSKASVTNQGITYEAVNPGIDGNDLRVSLKMANAGEALNASVQGSAIMVGLNHDLGTAAALELPSLTYTAVTPGVAGNAIAIIQEITGSGQSTVATVQNNTVRIKLGTTNGGVATAYLEGMNFTATVPGTAGNISVIIQEPFSSTSDLNAFADAFGDVTVQLGGEESAAGYSTLADVAAAIQATGRVEVEVVGDGTAILGYYNGMAVLSGGGANFEVTATAAQVAAAVQANTAAAALVQVTVIYGELLGAMSASLTGGEAPKITSRVIDVVNLLNGNSAVSSLLNVTGEGEELMAPAGPLALSGGGVSGNYTWDAQNRLTGVTMPSGQTYSYAYDYRTRRIGTERSALSGGPGEQHTAIVFAGGLSLAEYETATAQTTIVDPLVSTVHYVRGPDMGGGVGGLLYSVRNSSTTKYNLSNGRGDIVAQSDASAALTWTASYEAYG